MKIIFTLAAVAFLAMSLWYAWRRPGFLAAAFMGSYGLAVLFGPSGAALGLAALGSALSIWAVRPTSRFTSPPPELALFAWALLSALSYITAMYPDIAKDYLEALLGLAATAYLMGRTYGDQRTFVRDFVIGGIAVLLICAPVVMASATATGDLAIEQNSVGLGAILEVPIVGCMALLLFAPDLEKKWRRAIAAVLFLIALPFIAILGNRSSLLAPFVVYVFFFILRMRRPHAMRVLLITVLAIIAAVALGAVALFTLKDVPGADVLALGVGRLVMNFTVGHSGHTYIDPSAQNRLLFYKEALDLIVEAPFFGHGIGSFGYIADYGGMNSYPHNIFLEILINNGFLGLTLFLLAVVPLAYVSLKRTWARDADWQDIFIAGMALESLVRLQVSMTVFSAKGFFFMLGILMAQWAAQLRRARDTGNPAQPAGSGSNGSSAKNLAFI